MIKTVIMRNVFVILLLLISSGVQAQYSEWNSYSRKAMVMYEKTSDGFYKRITDRAVERVDGLMDAYAYDKKAQILYVVTENGNYAVTLTKEYAKVIKKDETIRQLKGDELSAIIGQKTQYLDQKFTLLNSQRTQFIQDSIAKAKADSIEHIRELERQKAERNAAAERYRNSHNYRRVPANDISLHCSLCDKSFSEDTLFCVGIKNDSIYFATSEDGDLDQSFLAWHAAKIPFDLAKDKTFLYHYDIFKDSLTNDTIDYQERMMVFNWLSLDKYEKNIKRIAPYGYFDGWGWDDEYSMLTFNFRYVNTNPKTIKYITVYFKVTNDVGDVRKTGYFKGTGPLKEGESASWDWDSSSYFVAGDASKMRITKVVITWMNGKQQVVTGQYLQFNSKD